MADDGRFDIYPSKDQRAVGRGPYVPATASPTGTVTLQYYRGRDDTHDAAFLRSLGIAP